MPRLFKLPNEIELDMETLFTNINLVKLIVKWRKHLIIIILAAAGLAVLFSSPWFIKPKFRSTAVIYPSNLIPYSSETPTELMLQVFQSDDIRDSLISKFNLAMHYDLDTTDRYYKIRLVREFTSNVEVKRTEYESVIIEVLDTDPLIACAMVKEMVNQFNNKVRSLYREKSLEVLKIASDQLTRKQIQIDTLQSKLDTMRNKYGLLDYKVQTKEAVKAYFKTLSGGKGNLNTINNTLTNLKEKGSDFVYFNDLFYASIANYSKLKEDYDNALKDVTKELTYINYVSSPVPALKKSYPIRWLIVVVTILATFAFSMTTIIVVEGIKARNKKQE